MHSVIVETVLSNLWVACLLAVFVYLLSRWVRRPALIHALWIVVLAKLVVPPLWAVELTANIPAALSYVVPQRAAGTPRFVPSSWLPRFSELEEPPQKQTPEEIRRNLAVPPMAGGTRATEESSTRRILAPFFAIAEFFVGDRLEAASPVPTLVTPRRPNATSPLNSQSDPALEPWHFVIRRLVLVCWLAGALGCVGWGGCRLLKFTALLRLSEPAPLWLHKETERLAAQIHLDRLPQVWLVPGPISPMLWAFGGNSRLLFPRELLLSLDADSRQTLLLHELVHLRRRDHRVRMLETLATAIYWWHPLLWWARREVHSSEEACCDAWVVSQLPERRRTYAEAILRTVDFLAEYRCALPPAASGLGGQHLLRNRLTQIMQGRTPRDLPRGGRWLVVVAASVSLPFLPTIVEAERAARNHAVVTPASPFGSVMEATPSPGTVDGSDSREGSRSAELTRHQEAPPLHFSSSSLRPADANAVMAFAISSDKCWAAAAFYDGTVEVWSLKSRTKVTWCTKPMRQISAVAFSPNASVLVLAQEPGLLSLWDWRRDERPRVLASAHERSITALACAPTGSLLATCGEDRRICLWNLETGQLVRSVVAHKSAVRSVCWSPDGVCLATGGDDGAVHLWNAPSLTLRRVWKDHNAAVRCVRFAPPHGQLLASADEHGTVKCWNPASGLPGPELTPHGDMVWSLAFSPTGSLLATGGFDGHLLVRDLRVPRQPAHIRAAESIISGLEFGGSEQGVWVASYDGSIQRWIEEPSPEQPSHSGITTDVLPPSDAMSASVSADLACPPSASDDPRDIP